MVANVDGRQSEINFFVQQCEGVSTGSGLLDPIVEVVVRLGECEHDE